MFEIIVIPLFNKGYNLYWHAVLFSKVGYVSTLDKYFLMVYYAVLIYILEYICNSFYLQLFTHRC